MDLKLNLSNWNYTHFKTGPLKVMVSCGVHSNKSMSPEEQTMVYWVSVLKEEFEEVFQKEFEGLGLALQWINEKYSHWDFVDTTKAQDSGCDSCSNSK